MKALLLLAFGGPQSLEEVEPFLTRLFRGRRPSPEQLERIKERYQLIGGSSPLPEITRGQASALEKKLNQKGYSFRSYVGMRYGHPLIEETLKEIDRDGIRELIAIPMAPFRSRASTGAYVEEVTRALKGLEKGMTISFVEGWYSHPLFIRCGEGEDKGRLMEFTPERERAGPSRLHGSQPPKIDRRERSLCEGDGGERRKVLKGMDPFPWHIAFQSKGGGPEEWIGPGC